MPIQFTKEPFANRHIGPSEADIKHMLKLSDVDSISQLIGETIPEKIRLDKPLDLPLPLQKMIIWKISVLLLPKMRFSGHLSGWGIMKPLLRM